jgi:hypothetical protein
MGTGMRGYILKIKNQISKTQIKNEKIKTLSYLPFDSAQGSPRGILPEGQALYEREDYRPLPLTLPRQVRDKPLRLQRGGWWVGK